MNPFEWKDSYSVKVVALDNQHKKLFATAEELHKAMLAGQGRDKAAEVLNRLIDYTVDHFATEEKMMEKHNYPLLATHRAEHRALTDKVVTFRKEYDAGKVAIPMLMTFLLDWLKHHIQTVDQKYSGFLNAHGVR